MCSIIFCEAVAIYGVIVAIILQTKIDYVDQKPDGLWPTAAYTAGYAIFGSGLTTGWANLACGCGPCLDTTKRMSKCMESHYGVAKW
jgi:V-type H+-transporting ATPase proteolipid subunit